MSSLTREAVKRLFHEALDVPAERRSEWLDRHCGGDAAVRAEVERLIAAHLAAGSFMDRPIIDLHGGPQPPAGARVGSWLGPYRLDALLGAGGMGEVYRARDAELGRTVAVKVVGRDEASAHDRLRREARHASRLNHPHICTIHHVGDHDGSPFIVMELVAGQPLSDLIPPTGLPVATALDYGRQVLDALDHAHGHQVIHRDLKTSNVMVRPDGQLKLLDFGLARRLDTTAAGTRPLPDSVLHATAAAGTLPYMAPEIVRGEQADTRSDLWAYGVLLYEMLTGRLPFRGRTPLETSALILSAAPDPMPPHVPRALAACVMRCLEKERQHRPRSTADVKSRLDAVAADLSARRTWRRRAARWAAALAVASAVAVAGWRSQRPEGTGAGVTIAVLPFENLSGDPAQDYFADGVTESLIRELRQTAGLQVISTTTAMRYRGTGKALDQVANELKVGAIIHGTVRNDAGTVSIAARLLRDGVQPLWSDSFERPAREVLAVQRDIVTAAATRLVPLSAEDTARLSQVRTIDPAVYESYLKGRYQWNRRTQASLHEAVDHFRAAIAGDPTYAPAYAGLADCYNQLGTVMVAGGSPAQMRPQAIAAALAALRIDGSLGEAHAALGYARHYDWQWDAAGEAFRKALELDPNNPLVHIWYANYLVSLRRLNEAVAHVGRAKSLDPFSPVVMTNVGWTLSYAERHEEAIAAYREALALDPDYIQAHMRLASAYRDVSRLDAAFAQHQNVLRLMGRRSPALIGEAILHGLAGHRRETLALLDEVHALPDTEYVSPFALAQPYVTLGQFDRAFELLERAYAERSNGMVYLAVEPVVRRLQGDPRYEDLLKRVGLVR